MTTFVFAFVGAMIGGIFINYVLQGSERLISEEGKGGETE